MSHNCPTCNSIVPDRQPDGICCDCGNEFTFTRMFGIEFPTYRVMNGKEFPICRECANKDAIPCLYVERGTIFHENGIREGGR